MTVSLSNHRKSWTFATPGSVGETPNLDKLRRGIGYLKHTDARVLQILWLHESLRARNTDDANEACSSHECAL
ncbi:MAG: hypothetical protein RI554_11145 [Trueperaceae bacterium]|nr:hypothetical protein [Trueperaceae bacterium]